MSDSIFKIVDVNSLYFGSTILSVIYFLWCTALFNFQLKILWFCWDPVLIMNDIFEVCTNLCVEITVLSTPLRCHSRFYFFIIIFLLLNTSCESLWALFWENWMKHSDFIFCFINLLFLQFVLSLTQFRIMITKAFVQQEKLSFPLITILSNNRRLTSFSYIIWIMRNVMCFRLFKILPNSFRSNFFFFTSFILGRWIIRDLIIKTFLLSYVFVCFIPVDVFSSFWDPVLVGMGRGKG